MFSFIKKAKPATGLAQLRCFKVWGEAKTCKHKHLLSLGYQKETRERMKQRKCPGCLQFPLNLVQVSTVASYTTRYEFQQDAQILWKDGYFSQVLSLHQVTVALKPSLLHSFYGSTTNISVYSSSVTAENFLIPWRERHRQMRQHFPAQFCTGEPVTLPKRLPFTPLNILI